MKKSFIISVLLATVLGIAIAWIDSRPNWDNTVISAFQVLLAALFCGYLASHKPWLIALAVSIWIPLFGVVLSQNYGGLLALIPGFIGAFLGFGAKKIIVNP